MPPLRIAATALALAILLGGCQRAERYGSRPGAEPTATTQAVPEPPKKADAEPPINPDIQWIDVGDPPGSDVLIDFVHPETSPDEWSKLTKFWNAPALTQPGQVAAVIGLPPLTAGAMAGSNSANIIKIRVPLGLPDPRLYVPAGNPLTLGKWELGRRLFFDTSWLGRQPGTSCATCHRPDHGFADRERIHGSDGFNAPSLINCGFNHRQFWDGRAGQLEEVVQRTLADERPADLSGPFRHTWGGVIGRLRNKPAYYEAFNKLFGKPPGEPEGKETANITQDTVGRALACFLRTILAGDSVHDRAVREQARKQSPTLRAEHYEAVLDDAALKKLDRVGAKKTDVAAELFRGYRLFHGRDEARPLTNCVVCHSGRNFTDNDYHNLGIDPRPDERAGRFAHVPVGQKSRYLIDAYKTPTLRNLLRTGPYFHNGSMNSLREVVQFYNLGAGSNTYMDPGLRGKDGQTRLLDLGTAETDALVLFLAALDGGDVDDILKKP